MNYLFAILSIVTMFSTSTYANIKLVINDVAPLNFKEQALPKVQGELKKIDLEQRKLTIKHKDIPNLDMPGMTMVFKADQKIDLSKFKISDQVLITVDNINGAYTVLTMEK